MVEQDQLRAQLHALYQRGPVERGILDILSRREKDRRQTTVTTFVNELLKCGVRVPRQRVVQAVKDLAATGLGRYLKGVHGYPTRIEWIVPVTEVGRLVAQGLTGKKTEKTPGMTTAELRAQRDALLHDLGHGKPISRSLLVGLDDQERLLVGGVEGDFYVVGRCLDPASVQRGLLAVEDLANALSESAVLGELSAADVLDWPEGILAACEDGAPAVVADLARALRALVYANATPPALRLVPAGSGEGETGDPG